MSSVTPAPPRSLPTSIIGKAAAVLGTFLRQVRVALGIRGVVWASAAGIVGVVSCLVAFAVIASAINTTNIAGEVYEADQTSEIAAEYRLLVRRLQPARFSAAGVEGRRMALASWREFNSQLTAACADGYRPSATADLLSSICAGLPAFRSLVQAELDAYEPPARPMIPEVEEAMRQMGRALHELNAAANLSVRDFATDMAGQYRTAILVLTISTAGFAGAGLMMIILVGRGSMRHYDQWRDASAAAASAAEARDLLTETIEALPAGMVLYDAQDRLMMFNSLAASVTPSLKRPGIVGSSYTDLAAENGREREAAGLGSAEAWIVEQLARFRSKGRRGLRQLPDGRWFEMYEHATPSGRTVGLRVDVTERQTRELEIAQARDAYHILVDSLSDVVFAVDTKGKFTFAGGGVAKLFGMPATQLVGTRFKEYMDPADWARLRDVGAEALASPDSDIGHIEFPLTGAGGGRRHVELKFRKTLHSADPNVALSGVIQDVEERAVLAQRLDEEMKLLRSIVEAGGALIVMVNRDLRIVVVNREFAALTGVGEFDAVGRLLTDVVPCPLDAAVLAGWLDPSTDLQDHKPVQYSNALTDPSGRRMILSVTATPVHDESGMTCNIVFVGVDDTARRDTELELFDANRLKGIGEMAATMAHEVNQPLQVIHIAAEVAAEEIAEAESSGAALDLAFVQGKLERIVTQVERASRLVKGLRAHARNTLADAAAEFDVGIAVRGAVDLTDHLVQQAGATLAVAVPIALPPVLGHVTRLEQVLINLINNARDALEEVEAENREKLITVLAEMTEQDGREFVRIVVEDTGKGIADDAFANLFMPFMTTKERGKGTGLGLPLCRRIVEEMGGTIAAANRPGGGARFEVQLPVVSKLAVLA